MDKQKLWAMVLSRNGEQRGSELVVNQQQRRRTPRNRSADVFGFIKAYIEKNGIPPSVLEVQRGCNLSSTSHAHYYLTQLKSQGRLDWTPFKIRTLRVTD